MKKMKNKTNSKKGSITLYLVFIIFAVIIITLSAVVAPFLVQINTEFYKAGADILKQSNASIQSITDAATKAEIQDTIDTALQAESYNIQVNATLYKYGWVLVIGLTAIIIFMFTRRLVEVGGLT